MSTPAKETTTTTAVSDNARSPEEYERLANLHDSYKPIWLTETIQLGPLLPSDKDALLEYLNDVRIHQWLYGPPNPYKPEDADFWINGRVDRMTANGTPLNFCFRDMARGGKAIGSVGVSNESDDRLDGDDTGYWLAPEYHGQGLMAKALKMMLRKVSIDEVGKRKFNSHAFEGNWASRRTLEKAGFVYQPDLEKTVVKDGKDINIWVFRMTLTDEDIAKQGAIAEATPAPSLAL
ncbi:acyl-CoA N-acyltransferase [Dissophora ornata]|nr:acyl-CoA N-acyltransferase [Dissophora ornata]